MNEDLSLGLGLENKNELSLNSDKNENSLDLKSNFNKEMFKEFSEVDPTKMVNALHNSEIVKAASQEETKAKLSAGAKKVIANIVDAKVADASKQRQDSEYNLKKEACENFGKTQSCPQWQQTIMVWGDAFWFAIYWLIALVTICPIMVFSKGLRGVLKVGWVSLIVAILIYIFIAVCIPLILSLRG